MSTSIPVDVAECRELGGEIQKLEISTTSGNSHKMPDPRRNHPDLCLDRTEISHQVGFCITDRPAEMPERPVVEGQVADRCLR